tara:strand:+ start:6131 stop:6589 length:459 start_codon:yes stop_codon:yes gene_type:complete
MSFRQIKSFDLSDYNLEREQAMEYQHISEESKLLKEVFQDLNKLVQQSKEPLEEIDSIVANSVENVEKGNTMLTKAVKRNKTKNTITFIAITSLLGACIGGPLGGCAIAGISMAVSGSVTVAGIVGGALVGAGAVAGTFGGAGGVLYNAIKK